VNDFLDNDLLDPEPRRRPLLFTPGVAVIVAAFVALITLAIVVAIRGVWSGADDQTSSLTPSFAAPIPSQVVAQPLQLVAGTKSTSGVTVGYPHSTVGAVSAAAAYWSLMASTLDLDRAATIGGIIADDSWTAAPAEFASNATDARRSLELSTTGDPAANASIQVEADAYQLRAPSADLVTVLLLGYLRTTSPSQGDQTRISIFTGTMHWDGEDWKIERDPGTDYSGLKQEPGTAAAAGAGWLELQS
jgi:hypothetical protein